MGKVTITCGLERCNETWEVDEEINRQSLELGKQTALRETNGKSDTVLPLCPKHAKEFEAWLREHNPRLAREYDRHNMLLNTEGTEQ